MSLFYAPLQTLMFLFVHIHALLKRMELMSHLVYWLRQMKKKRKNYESINSLVYVKSADVTCLKTVLAEHYLNIQAFYKAFHHDLG